MSNTKNILIVLGLIIFSGFGYFIGRKSATSNPKNDEVIYAQFNGGVVTDQEVQSAIRLAKEQEDRVLKEAKKLAVEELVRAKLLEIQGKKLGVSGQEVLNEYQKNHQNDPVTPEEFHFYILNQGFKESQLSKADKENYTKVIQSQKVMAGQKQLISELISKADVRILVAE